MKIILSTVFYAKMINLILMFIETFRLSQKHTQINCLLIPTWEFYVIFRKVS